MTESVFLLLLIPYALLLIWGIRRLGFGAAPTIILGLATVGVVWGVLYVSFALGIFPPDAADAFASVEAITRDVPDEWLWRYLAERFGWLFGVAFFCACWCIARLWRARGTLHC